MRGGNAENVTWPVRLRLATLFIMFCKILQFQKENKVTKKQAQLSLNPFSYCRWRSLLVIANTQLLLWVDGAGGFFLLVFGHSFHL